MPKSNRELFIEFVEKEASSGAITDDQLKGIFQTAHQKYKLTPTIADKALKDEGFIADDGVNYFEELGFTIETLVNQDEATIEKRVADAHLPRFSRALSTHTDAGIKTRDLLNRAKNILTDPKKRRRHIDWLNRGIIYRFSNGDVATSIPELASLMKKHTKEATNALYRGDIAQNLDRIGERNFAGTARAVVREFSRDRNTGLMAMVAILLGKVRMQNGNEAGTPQQLAHLIDQNWEEAKTLLYNGFFAFYLEYTNQRQLAKVAKDVTRDNPSRKDIGLEEFVQKLHPRIGHPETEVSHPKIDFGRMDVNSQNTIDLEITSRGRGFLYGDVQIASTLPGLQISNTYIRGSGVVSVKLDTSQLTPNKTYQTTLTVNTKHETLEIPISCYVSYPVQQSAQRVAFSGLSVAAIALVTRLIIQQFGSSGWLGTHLTEIGFIDWTQYWSLVEWFEWPWFGWKVPTLSEPGSGLGFVIALTSLGVGIFIYWYFFFKKKRVR